MKAPTKSPDQRWRAPHCPLGLIVLWYPGRGHSGYPAIVTQHGPQAIEIAVFPTESQKISPRRSVRHTSDPAFDTLLDQSGGLWDYTPEYKLLCGLAQLLLDSPNVCACTPTQELVKLRPSLAGLVYIPEASEYTAEDRRGDDPDHVGA